MKSRNLIYMLLAASLTAGGVLALDADAATKKGRSKARTSQTAKSKKKSKSSKGKTSSSKKKTTSKKRTSSPKPAQPAPEQPSNDSLTLAVNSYVIERIPEKMNPGGLRINSVKPDSKNRTTRVSLNENFTYLPVTQELISDLRKSVSQAMPDSLRDFNVTLNVGNRNLSYYITKVDKLPEAHRKNIPFVTATEPYVNAKKGMQGDIVALWHSHGRYFRPGSAAWMWQRGFLFESIEDTYTMSYMLPFIVPMVENAGGYVMLPRERDINRHEVIVDNDTNDEGEIYSQPYYKEKTGARKWATGEGEGFIYDLPDFRDTENPFENGTYRQTTTIRSGAPSVAAWYADIPEDGEYAVYVSYKTLPNSTEDAHYTVNYSGGSKEFKVNQTMGGGTWIYLGTFPLEAGYSDTEPVVTLTNLSDKEADRVVTADAVKIGGGMGNIARSAKRSDVYYDPSTPDSGAALVQAEKEAEQAIRESEEEDDDDSDDEGDDVDTQTAIADTSQPAQSTTPAKKGPAPTFRTSGMPRYLEGARYWLQWAGMPERIYSPYHGSDDYKDDYTSRGHWVNYLAGGSRVLPNREGLNIPIDLTLALHSDAGKRSDDSFVGTLGIYFTNNGDSYKDGTARINSRMLTDMVMRQITNDIRQSFEPRWTRRSMWDKTYVEARVPEVPTTLIELMSHQNFADMQYGLDPAFRFMVGRSIYKAMGRFIAERKGREFVVQPLPVKNFAIQKVKKGHYRLTWDPTPDPLESTAMPTRYIIEERSGDDLGFHKTGETTSNHFEIKAKDHDIHSFRIIAANEGGVSFASETLAFREGDDNSDPVMIVNGFTRVSAPSHFSSDGRAGFDSEEDFGVPYIRDISFTGHQTEYRRNAGESFGRSASNYVDKVIAGNTFDYPYEHGKALASAGRGFVSASAGAVEDGEVKLDKYKTVDLILGRQKLTVTGNGKSGIRFNTIPAALRKSLTEYTDKGGDLVVSGENIASDLYDYRQDNDARGFAAGVLGITQPADSLSRTRSGKIHASGSGLSNRDYTYSSTLNEDRYIVQHPDVISPSGELDSETLLTFTDTGLGAGILSRRGKSKVAVSSVPLEAITDEKQRQTLILELIRAVEE